MGGWYYVQYYCASKTTCGAEFSYELSCIAEGLFVTKTGSLSFFIHIPHVCGAIKQIERSKNVKNFCTTCKIKIDADLKNSYRKKGKALKSNSYRNSFEVVVITFNRRAYILKRKFLFPI